MGDSGRWRLGTIARYRPIGFVDFTIAKHLVHAGQRLGGLGEDDEAAYGAVEAVDHPEENVARLGVGLFEPLLDGFDKRLVAGLVALDDFAGRLVDDDDVVVFVDYFHLTKFYMLPPAADRRRRPKARPKAASEGTRREVTKKAGDAKNIRVRRPF